jgi:hypothetical protein
VDSLLGLAGILYIIAFLLLVVLPVGFAVLDSILMTWLAPYVIGVRTSYWTTFKAVGIGTALSVALFLLGMAPLWLPIPESFLNRGLDDPTLVAVLAGVICGPLLVGVSALVVTIARLIKKPDRSPIGVWNAIKLFVPSALILLAALIAYVLAEVRLPRSLELDPVPDPPASATDRGWR